MSLTAVPTCVYILDDTQVVVSLMQKWERLLQTGAGLKVLRNLRPVMQFHSLASSEMGKTVTNRPVQD